jgi:hypothetical protein
MNAYYTGKRDPINCPANQPDPTRDYHDVPFPEGTQPKPTGEWTVYSVMKLRQKHWHEEDKNNAIAIAHNAAIATAKTATGMETELPTEIHVKIDPSLLPKPASEWTVETIAVIRGRDGDFGLAAAINAALANKQETIKRLQQSLHDALEKIDRLEDPEEK